jgi:hypothetical protein
VDEVDDDDDDDDDEQSEAAAKARTMSGRTWVKQTDAYLEYDSKLMNPSSNGEMEANRELAGQSIQKRI